MRAQKITFGEMRSDGCTTGIVVFCSDYRCSHSKTQREKRSAIGSTARNDKLEKKPRIAGLLFLAATNAVSTNDARTAPAAG
jgi:hypothetical protein